MKQLHDLVLTRTSSREAFGFRIIGGKDEGQTFKVNLVFHKEIFPDSIYSTVCASAFTNGNIEPLFFVVTLALKKSNLKLKN
jgi:hypothetical protein